MLTYSFNSDNSSAKKTLYEQLYEYIKKDILSGVLAPGEKLPSKRAFSKNLGISIITIENTYAQLIAEGYLYSIPQKGYYISAIDDSISRGSNKNTSLTGSLPSAIPVYYADFASNQTESALFPFSVWAKLTRETLINKREELMMNPSYQGVRLLREAIAAYLLEFRGMKVSSEQIIIGAGTEYLYGLLLQFFESDYRYAVEDPGYQKIRKVYQNYHVDSVAIPMDQHGIQIKALEESNANIIHLSPSHHFPTGITMPVSRRYELLSWAASSSDHFIIEDEYDSEFRLTGRPIPTLQSIDVMNKVIYINTFTKSIASTIRISYMVLPAALLDEYAQKMSFYSCPVSNFEQYTLASFIQDGFFEKHINRMRNYYHNKRDVLLSVIKKSPLSSLVEIREEDAGLHFLMYIHTEIPDALLSERARDKEIHITPLSLYYSLEHTTEHIFIFNYSCIREDSMEEAINRLYSCLIT